jgi:hypothetical protein
VALIVVCPASVVKVPEPDVYKVAEGALIVILNARSAFKEPSVALIVKLDVVFDPTELGVPDITPVVPLKLMPEGTAPDIIEYETV